MLINYNMCSSNHFSYPAVSHVFQGLGSSGSRFFRVQGPGLGSRVPVQDPGPGSGFRVRVQGPGPGFRSSHYFL